MLKYLEHLKNKAYKPNTYNTKINSLTNFNNYLKDKEVVGKDFIFGKDKIGLSGNRQVEIYSDKEMELIEVYLEGENISQRDRLIIKILKELGIRVSELINLKLEDIDVIGLQVEVHGKNNKRRTLPIKTELAESIKKYIAGERKNNKHSSSKYLFVSERADKLHRNTVLDLVKKRVLQPIYVVLLIFFCVNFCKLKINRENIKLGIYTVRPLKPRFYT